jgi:hypothetical protein
VKGVGLDTNLSLELGGRNPKWDKEWTSPENGCHFVCVP